MSKEIKSISVAPSEEEATINFWQIWGWELKSTQEVKTQDVQTFTGQDSDGTEHYKTTKGEHYIKLTFEREKSMPNYAELCDLEQKYNAASQIHVGSVGPIEPEDKGPGCFGWGFSILAVFFGVCFAFVTFLPGVDSVERWTVAVMGICLIIVGAAIFIISKKLSKSAYPKKHAQWENDYKDWEKKFAEYNQAKKMMPEMIERAKSLLE